MPFLGLNSSLTKKKNLSSLSPIYFSVYPTLLPLGAAGTPLSSLSFATVGIVRNRATRAIVLGNYSSVDAPSTIPPASQKSVQIRFIPTTPVAGWPFSLTFSAALSVNRTTPTISTYPTLGSIQYGQTKSEVIFSGGVASCPGTFAFSSSLTRVYAPGTYASLDCTFTPTDTLNFKPVDFVSPNPLVVARRSLLYNGSFNLTGGGLNQPLSNFTISPSSDFYIISSTINGRSTRLNPTGYSFISPLTKIVTGTESEQINVLFSAEDTLYYGSGSTCIVPGYFPSLSCLPPTLAAWTLAIANTSFSGFNASTNKVTTEGSSIGYLSVSNAYNNTAGSSNSQGYRFYGKTTPTTLTYEQAVTNASYISFDFTASRFSKKVVSGLLRFLCFRGGSGPSKLALVYSDNPTFAYYNIRILSQDVAVPTNSADISFELAGTLLTNPITISENCTGYFRIYYYGQTSQTSPITLVGNRNQDIGFTGVEVQALPSLSYNPKPLHRLQPGAKTNNEATLDDGILYYWQSPLHDLASFRFETFNLSSSSQLKPTYVKEGMNSKPSVRFVSGSSMFMGARSPVGRSSTSSTIIMVARFNSGSGTLYSEGPNGFWLGALDYGVAICEANRNIVIGQAPNSISSNPVVITVRKLSNGNNYLYVNGQLVTNATSTIGSFSNPVVNPLGYQLTVSSAASGQNPTTYVASLGSILSNSTTVNPTPFPFSGLMGDAFFIEDDLPEQDRIFLENYLKNKYGIDQPTPTCDDMTSKVLMTGENGIWDYGPRLLTQLVPPYNPYGTGFTYEFGNEVVRHDGSAWIYHNSDLGEIARSYSPVAWPWLATWPDFVATKVCAPDTSTPAPNLIFPERINITGPGINGNFVLSDYSAAEEFAYYIDDVSMNEFGIEGNIATLYNNSTSGIGTTTTETTLPIFSFPSSLTGGYRTSTLHTTPTLAVSISQLAQSKVYDNTQPSLSFTSTPSISYGEYLLSSSAVLPGTYQVSLVEGGKNSKFIWGGPYPSVNYTITKRPVTPTMTDRTATWSPYGTNYGQVLTGGLASSSSSGVGIVSGDAQNTLTGLLQNLPPTNSNVGTYTVSVKDNYTHPLYTISGYTNNKTTATVTITKGNSSIYFSPSINASTGKSVTLFAEAYPYGQPLEVAYSIVSGGSFANISGGNVLNFTGAGTVVVRASTSGNINLNGSFTDRSINITVPTPDISSSAPSIHLVYSNGYGTSTGGFYYDANNNIVINDPPLFTRTYSDPFGFGNTLAFSWENYWFLQWAGDRWALGIDYGKGPGVLVTSYPTGSSSSFIPANLSQWDVGGNTNSYFKVLL
jgi:hypothetical protein